MRNHERHDFRRARFRTCADLRRQIFIGGITCSETPLVLIRCGVRLICLGWGRAQELPYSLPFLPLIAVHHFPAMTSHERDVFLAEVAQVEQWFKV